MSQKISSPWLAQILMVPTVLLSGAAHAELFESVDHKGDCYGVPAGQGATKTLAAGKAYALEAYGSEFGHHCKTDQGRFVYQEMEGDFDVSAQVRALGNDRKTSAKACLMVRESAAEPSSRFAAIMAVSDLPFARRHDHGFPDSFTFDFRVQRGGNLANDGFRYSGQELKERRRFPRVWLRLQRKGERITAFISKNGGRWKEVPPEDSWLNLPTFPLGKRVAVGMCLSSEPEVKPDIRAFARFDNLRGFRTTGEARLAAAPVQAAAKTDSPVAPLPPPARRPLGLGKAMPLQETKFQSLTDGGQRPLGDFVGEKGTLLVLTSPACRAPDATAKRLAAVARPFAARGIRTVFFQTEATAPGAQPAKARAGSIPVLHDADAALARALGATAAGQAFLFDKAGKLVYSGAASGLDLAQRRRPFLKQALTAVASGRWPEVAQTPAPSCPLSATAAAPAR